MIKFSLICKQEHDFEAWFQNSVNYDLQRRKGLISCPICGDEEIDKAIMAPNIGKKSNQKSEKKPKKNHEKVDKNHKKPYDLQPDDFSRELQEFARSINKYVQKNATNVGDKFYEEAKKMHYMEKDEKAIYGTASNDELIKLEEEGIKTFSLPRLPEDQN